MFECCKFRADPEDRFFAAQTRGKTECKARGRRRMTAIGGINFVQGAVAQAPPQNRVRAFAAERYGGDGTVVGPIGGDGLAQRCQCFWIPLHDCPRMLFLLLGLFPALRALEQIRNDFVAGVE